MSMNNTPSGDRIHTGLAGIAASEESDVDPVAGGGVVHAHNSPPYQKPLPASAAGAKMEAA